MITTTNLAKHYGRVRALRGLDLHIEPGEISVATRTCSACWQPCSPP
jgi:hypothetical protein